MVDSLNVTSNGPRNSRQANRGRDPDHAQRQASSLDDRDRRTHRCEHLPTMLFLT